MSAAVCASAGRKLFVEPHFLQLAKIRAGADLAAAVVGTGAEYDPLFLSAGPTCRVAANSLLAVADLCRLSELWGMDA